MNTNEPERVWSTREPMHTTIAKLLAQPSELETLVFLIVVSIVPAGSYDNLG